MLHGWCFNTFAYICRVGSLLQVQMTDTLPVFSTMEPSSSDKVLEHMGTVCLAVAKFLNQRATLWGMLWSLKSSWMGMKELRNPHDIAFSLYISPKFSTSNLMLLSRDIPFESNNWFPSESIIDIHGNLKGTTWWWPLSAAVVTWTVPRRSLWLGAKHDMYPTGNEYLQKCILFGWQLEVV